jgi:PKD repeat protein
MRFVPSLGRLLRRVTRRAEGRHGARGQSLVELAMITPVLLLFLLVAIDFGRVYLGYINLQNLARIAANFAATNPDTEWGNPSDAKRQEYTQLVLNDATATNCDLPGNPDTVPDPIFTDQNGDGATTGLGDLAEVSLTCEFGIITPIISSVIGNPVDVSASATFPVRSGGVDDGGGGGGGPLAPTAAFSADPPLTGTAPFTVQFRDESGGPPTSWFWEFGDGATSTAQDPVHEYLTSGIFSVTLTVANSGGTSQPFSRANYVSVSSPGSIDFVGSPNSGDVGLDVTFSVTAPETPTAYAWTFGDGGTSTDAAPTHEYNAAGAYTVSVVITLTDGDHTVTKPNYININPTLCLVPDFVGTSTTGAQGLWNGRGFTTTVTYKQPNRPWTIKGQSLTGNSSVPCSSIIEVSKNP